MFDAARLMIRKYSNHVLIAQSSQLGQLKWIFLRLKKVKVKLGVSIINISGKYLSKTRAPTSSIRHFYDVFHRIRKVACNNQHVSKMVRYSEFVTSEG